MSRDKDIADKVASEIVSAMFALDKAGSMTEQSIANAVRSIVLNHSDAVLSLSLDLARETGLDLVKRAMLRHYEEL